MFRAIFLTTFAVFSLSAAAGNTQTLVPAGKQIAVNYSDLNISSPNGAQALIKRLLAAASQACGPAPDRRQFAYYHAYQDCVEDALSRSVATVNQPLVTESYRGLTTTRLADAISPAAANQ